MTRERIFGLLALAYVALTLVVYADYPRDDTFLALDDAEREGLALWRANNCQACHQLHGFGGFLGPDLTNRVTDETPAYELREILILGKPPMPAFGFDRDQRRALLAYLRAMNRSGRAVPAGLRSRNELPQEEHATHVDRLLERFRAAGGALPPAVAEGARAWSANGCGACHRPFTEGRYRAPDLMRAAFDRSPARIAPIVRDGQRSMPSFALDDDELRALLALLDWLAAERAQLTPLNDELLDREPFDWRSLPWFEYR